MTNADIRQMVSEVLDRNGLTTPKAPVCCQQAMRFVAGLPAHTIVWQCKKCAQVEVTN